MRYATSSKTTAITVLAVFALTIWLVVNVGMSAHAAITQVTANLDTVAGANL